MPTPSTLPHAIALSLKARQMVPEFDKCLVSSDRNRIVCQDEGQLWDYKRQINVNNVFDLAELSRDILAFHNAQGGVLIFGVADRSFEIVGLPEDATTDTTRLNQKIAKYVGPDIRVFQGRVRTALAGRILWLVFVPKRVGAPVPLQSNGPADPSTGKPVLQKNDYFVRDGAESITCRDPFQYARLFSGYSAAHVYAYRKDIDDPFFRLMAPHDGFIGRVDLVTEVMEYLDTWPIVLLSGHGGMGKTAVGIEATRRLYDLPDHGGLDFIVSLTAKHEVFTQAGAESRCADFSGHWEFLSALARVLTIDPHSPFEVLESEVLEFMEMGRGLLFIDNLETVRAIPSLISLIGKTIPRRCKGVRILLTSRLDLAIPGQKVSVGPLLDNDARDLLVRDLERAGVDVRGEAGAVNSLVTATRRVPLAIKWATTLAREVRPLSELAVRLTRKDAGHREFVQFTFATMFECLSAQAQQVALLLFRIGQSWTVPLTAICLAIDEEAVADAVDELQDRNIVLAEIQGGNVSISLLPETEEYLRSMWKRDTSLQAIVDRNLADAVTDNMGTDRLRTLSRDVQLSTLLQQARVDRAKRRYDRALRMIRAVLAWSAAPKNVFLAGQIQFEAGDRPGGLAEMHAALAACRTQGTMNEERIWLADVLWDSESVEERRDSVVVLSEVAREDHPSQEVLTSMLRRAVEMHFFDDAKLVLRRRPDQPCTQSIAALLLELVGQHDFAAECASEIREFWTAALRSGVGSAERSQAVIAALGRIGGGTVSVPQGA